MEASKQGSVAAGLPSYGGSGVGGVEPQFSLLEKSSWEAVALIQGNIGSADGGERVDLRAVWEVKLAALLDRVEHQVKERGASFFLRSLVWVTVLVALAPFTEVVMEVAELVRGLD